jgi:hypothetical protein
MAGIFIALGLVVVAAAAGPVGLILLAAAVVFLWTRG